MNQTENINELVSALSKAQSKMKPATFNRVNPHFKNRYADFTSCMDACRIPLSDNGLSIMQYCETVNEKLMLITMLAHTSGQWIKSHFPLNPAKMDSQSIGSAMTYAKRYSLSAMLGIVSDEEEDDDGEAAHGRGRPAVQSRPVSVKPLDNARISADQALEVEKLLAQVPADVAKGAMDWINQRGFKTIGEITSDFCQEVKTKLRIKIASLKQASDIPKEKEEKGNG